MNSCSIMSCKKEVTHFGVMAQLGQDDVTPRLYGCDDHLVLAKVHYLTSEEDND